MIHEIELRAEDVQQMCLKILREHLSLRTEGYRLDTDMTLNVLMKAAAENSSIEAASKDLADVAHSNSIRTALNSAMNVEYLREYEAEANAALAATMPAGMPQSGLEIAMDYHDEPFYGKTSELRHLACRGRAKDGTTHFYRIASAYVIWQDVRLTLALTYVLPEDSTLDVMIRLQNRLTVLGFTINVLYLDKGFCCTAVIRYLQRQRQPTIIACPSWGKTGGTKGLCQGRKSYRTTYTFSDGTQATIVAAATLPPGSNGKRHRKWLLFVVIYVGWGAKKICKRYTFRAPFGRRRRFGIECAYRQLRRVRIITNSLNPVLRFFFMGLALILVNTWVFLRWTCFRIPGPGPRRVDPKPFRLHRFAQLLRRAIEDTYGVIRAIPAHFSPQFEIY